MVEIRFDKKFTTIFSKLKDISTKQRIIKQIEKISRNPNAGKPMRYKRKATREVYIKPFRLSYIYLENKNHIYILDLYHKKKQ